MPIAIERIWNARAISEASGANPDVATPAASILYQPNVGLIGSIAATAGTIDGVLRIEIANGPEIDKNRDVLDWRLYPRLAVITSGVTVVSGEIVVSTATSVNIEIELSRMMFGWLRLRWVGAAGSVVGTATFDLTAKGAI